MQPVISLGERPEPAERHAAADLRRYVHQVTGALPVVAEGAGQADAGAPTFWIGTAATSEAVAAFVAAGTVPEPTVAESYTVTTVDGGVVVAGADAQGALYGTYRLVEAYGVRFFLGRDVVPARAPFTVPDVALDERPAFARRGLLPWHDFLCGPSGYDARDFRRYVDQLVKMRMNLLVLHNYAGGYPGRDIDEPFMSFTHETGGGPEGQGGGNSTVGYDGYLDTSVDNQRWGLAPTRADDLAFRAGDLMPYDVMASDAARATREQDEARANTFAKAKAMMREVVEYAQSRGVEVMLGTDFDLVPLPLVEAGCEPLAHSTLAARIDDVVTTYPTLHYLQMYYSESHDVTTAQAIEAYTFMHDYLADVAPHVRLVTGSWFQEERFAEMHAALPADVTFASLMPHDLTVKPDWAKVAATGRSAWAIPWIEIDGGLSEPQLAVRRMRQQLPLLRETGVDAVIGILWREQAVEANVAYLAADAWARPGEARDAADFYRDYATALFGDAAADEAASLFERIEDAGVYGMLTTTNQFPKLPEPSGMTTPEFGTWFFSGAEQAPRRADEWRALADELAALRPSTRDAAGAHELDYWTRTPRWMQHYWASHAEVPAAAQLTDPVAAWQALTDSSFRVAIDTYQHTVRDLTAFGGLVSAAGGRWYYADPPVDPARVNEQFHVFERDIRARLDLQPPHALRAHSTPAGAELTWTTYSGAALGGCHVYRQPVEGGEPVRVTDEPVTSGRFTDLVDGLVRYTVTAVGADGTESLPSFPDVVAAGDVPVDARLVVLPTPDTAVHGESFAVAATLLSDRRADGFTFALRYRPLGLDTWHDAPMRTNVTGRPTTFHGAIPGDLVTAAGVEYYVAAYTASGRLPLATAPVDAPLRTFTVVGTDEPDDAPGTPQELTTRRVADGVRLGWHAAPGSPRLYRVYRGDTGTPHPADYLTYVPATQTTFHDVGAPSTGGYTVVAVSPRGVTGTPATVRR